jgi:hypothetical protein
MERVEQMQRSSACDAATASGPRQPRTARKGRERRGGKARATVPRTRPPCCCCCCSRPASYRRPSDTSVPSAYRRQHLRTLRAALAAPCSALQLLDPVSSRLSRHALPPGVCTPRHARAHGSVGPRSGRRQHSSSAGAAAVCLSAWWSAPPADARSSTASNTAAARHGVSRLRPLRALTLLGAAGCAQEMQSGAVRLSHHTFAFLQCHSTRFDPRLPQPEAEQSRAAVKEQPL